MKNKKLNAKKLADELLEWISDEHNIFAKSFAHSKRILFKQLLELASSEPVLSDALTLAVEIQQVRIIEIILKKNSIEKIFPLLIDYLNDFRNFEKSTNVIENLRFVHYSNPEKYVDTLSAKNKINTNNEKESNF